MKLPVTNNTKMSMFVAGVMIPPGETKHFEEHHVPQSLRPGAKAEEPEKPPEDPVAMLLEKSIPIVAEALPGLSDEDYERMKTLEDAGQDRAGLQSAFIAEDLRRANGLAEG